LLRAATAAPGSGRPRACSRLSRSRAAAEAAAPRRASSMPSTFSAWATAAGSPARWAASSALSARLAASCAAPRR
jgi:hypothetical protein